MYRIPDIISHLLRPFVILRFGRERNCLRIFLTFDDGPEPESTPVILEILRKYNAKATFFTLGRNADEYPDLIEKILNEGHSVHYHSTDHLPLRKQNFGRFGSEIITFSQRYGSTAFRPPYGKTPLRYLIWLKRKRFRVVLWNVDLKDYREKPFSEKRLIRLADRIKSGDIILMHNRDKYLDKTAAILKVFLAHFQAKKSIFERIL